MGSAGATGGAQLRALAVRLRAAGSEGKGLRRRVRRNITAAVEPMKTAVQAEIRALPSKGHSGRSLREQLAKATKIRIRASGATALVRLEVAASAMPAGEQNLPAYMDGLKAWRHPVFGDRGVWVDQASHPYFAKAVRPHLLEVRAGVEAAVKETAASIRI